jgi:hypothetical protein
MIVSVDGLIVGMEKTVPTRILVLLASSTQ